MTAGAPSLGGLRRLSNITLQNLAVTGTLSVTGAITENADLTLANGKALQSDTTTGHTVLFKAYDVDGTAYKTFATLTNGNTPSFAIAAPSGGTVTIDGAVIGGTTAAAATVTTLASTAHTVTSASSDALTVGANGATNPVLKISASTASVATGISVTGAAAAGGVAVAAISSGTDENVTINAKGSGTITFNNTATGNVVLGRAATGVSVSVTGALTARSGTATPAAASAVAALLFSSTANLGIYWGSGSPSAALTAAQGSLYLATDGSSSSTRAFINSNGTTGWVAVTTAS